MSTCKKRHSLCNYKICFIQAMANWHMYIFVHPKKSIAEKGFQLLKIFYFLFQQGGMICSSKLCPPRPTDEETRVMHSALHAQDETCSLVAVYMGTSCWMQMSGLCSIILHMRRPSRGKLHARKSFLPMHAPEHWEALFCMKCTLSIQCRQDHDESKLKTLKVVLLSFHFLKYKQSGTFYVLYTSINMLLNKFTKNQPYYIISTSPIPFLVL